jgi:PhnB protein
VTVNPPEGYARVTPYLLYHDTDAAVEFLIRVFGFTEKYRLAGNDGKTAHAEVELEGGVIMLGTPSGTFRNPKELGERTATTSVYVDDVDAHFERASKEGAEITRGLADQFYGDRTYSALDPEGHAWSFATHVSDPTPAEVEAGMAEAAPAETTE